VSVRVGIGWGSFGAVRLTPDEFFPLVETLEQLGCDSIWLSDSATLGGPAPLATLAAIAARTEKMKLGTNVLVAPARNPVLLAKEMATVDAISGGRFLPGFGSGIDMEPEASVIGVARNERTARLEETMAIVRLLWPGEPVSYEGRFTSFEDVRLSPAPARAKLEIWLGGSAPAALRRTGRLADGWLASFVSPAEFAACVEQIKEAAAEAGRAIDEDHYGTTIFAAPSRVELPDRALQLLERRPGLLLEDHIALGAEALRELLGRYVEAGASKFVVVPIADDLPTWLAEIYTAAVAPVEAAAY
jgi:probable F420-dependent oxidoreductase